MALQSFHMLVLTDAKFKRLYLPIKIMFRQIRSQLVDRYFWLNDTITNTEAVKYVKYMFYKYIN